MANKITYSDKVGINPRKVAINQVQDRDMNEIKDMHNLNDDRITDVETELLLLETTGIKTYQTLADLQAVTPDPDEGTAAKVANDPTATNNGFYSIVSSVWIKDGNTIENALYKVFNITDFNSLISGSTTGNWLILDSVVLDGNKTIPSEVRLIFRGGDIDLNSFTLTGDKTQIDAGLSQILTTTGVIAGVWDVEARPEWMGAAGDGSTDDLVAMNAILSFKNIRLSKSTYFITDEIVMQSDVSFVGEQGSEFTGITTSNRSYFKFDDAIDNIILKDFKIDASTRANSSSDTGQIDGRGATDLNNITFDNLEILTAGNYNTGITFESSTGGLITDINIKNCKIVCTGDSVYGIRLEKETKRAIYENNYVSLTSASAFNAITVYEDGTDFKIVNNTVYLSGHSGIAVSPSSFGSIIGNRVSGVSGANEGGIEVEWKTEHGDLTSTDISIIGNIIDDCYFGIYVTKRDEIIADDVANLTITGNVITNSTIAGLKINYLQNSVISSNIIKDADNVGMSLAYCSFLNLTNNTIDSDSHAISFTGDSENINIQNNNINVKLGANGVYFAGTIIGYNISNNMLNFEAGGAASSSIRIDEGSKGLVIGNITIGATLRSLQLTTVIDSEFYNNYFENSTNYIGATGDPESVKRFNNTGIPDSTFVLAKDGGNQQTTILKIINDKNEDQGDEMTADIDFHLWDNNTRLETPQARIGVFGSSAGSQDAEAKGRLGFYINTGTFAVPVLELVMTITGAGVLNMINTPTSSAGLVSGDIWSDSGTLKIIA